MCRVVLAIVGLLLLAPAASAATTPTILYSADARGAIVTASGATHRVSLPAGTRATWFSDRPERRAGTTTLARIVGIWTASGFTADPPNAALLLTQRGATRTHVVALTDPRLRNGRVSFRIRAVRGGEEAGHAHRHALRAGRYARASLFIDDAAFSPCPASSDGSVTCALAVGQSMQMRNWNVVPSPVSVCALDTDEAQWSQWIAQVSVWSILDGWLSPQTLPLAQCRTGYGGWQPLSSYGIAAEPTFHIGGWTTIQIGLSAPLGADQPAVLVQR